MANRHFFLTCTSKFDSRCDKCAAEIKTGDKYGLRSNWKEVRRDRRTLIALCIECLESRRAQAQKYKERNDPDHQADLDRQYREMMGQI